jgi:hypothetical protein
MKILVSANKKEYKILDQKNSLINLNLII